MTPLILKSLHILGIAGWSVGLICLPYLYVQRRKLSGAMLYRLHNFTRFFYVALVSPAAFVAVATGTALIFVESTFEPWFAVKLAFVGAMVVVHITSGVTILSLFEPGRTYPLWRAGLVSGLSVAVICAILIAVLGKPEWGIFGALDSFFAPGNLGVMLNGIIAWWR